MQKQLKEIIKIGKDKTGIVKEEMPLPEDLGHFMWQELFCCFFAEECHLDLQVVGDSMYF